MHFGPHLKDLLDRGQGVGRGLMAGGGQMAAEEGLMVVVGRGLMTGRGPMAGMGMGQEAEKEWALVQDKVLLVLDSSPHLQRTGVDKRVVGMQ